MMYDCEINIAVGRSRHEKTWRNKKVKWSELCDKIKNTHRTTETVNEYSSMTKAEQAERKDVGGFVGGYLKDGKRRSGFVASRKLITLDIDYGTTDVWEIMTDNFDNAMAIYSTHKHRADKPRLRLLMPLDRDVDTTEYEAIARRIAGTIGIDLFDDSSFQAERLMYWPSTSKDGDYINELLDAPVISADEILASYTNYKDASEWPISSRVREVVTKERKKAGEPAEKPGLIGAFCRAYTISDAIETYLSDVYSGTTDPARYTYRQGSTDAGLVVYDDKFAYSHHGTDPTGGMLCNAFDLVRIHLYGAQDESSKEGTPINRLPSYTAMTAMCAKDKRVSQLLSDERAEEVKEDFNGVDKDDAADDWMANLKRSNNGAIIPNAANLIMIFKNDKGLKNILYDEFNLSDSLIGDLPWRKIVRNADKHWTNDDDSCLRTYIDCTYGIVGKDKINDAKRTVVSERKFHPVRYFINRAKWDGIPRVETLFIDYLNAEDTPFNRAITRKTLVAAVARVFDPGCKFDYVLTLQGTEGIGKSTILKIIANDWFSDSFTTPEGKEGMEQLRSVWILEISENAGVRKADVPVLKAYISKRVDKYRPPFCPIIMIFPRQCIMISTTNESNYMRGEEGNRRFWPLIVKPGAKKNMWLELTDYEVSQLWAEALVMYNNGEKLYLDEDMEKIARKLQKEGNEMNTDPRIGQLEEFLNTRLPVNWQALTQAERRSYIIGNNNDELKAAGTIRRDRVCVSEIINECFGERLDDRARYRSKDISSLMSRVGGWRKIGATRFGIYGVQKGYERDATEEDEEEL